MTESNRRIWYLFCIPFGGSVRTISFGYWAFNIFLLKCHRYFMSSLDLKVHLYRFGDIFRVWEGKFSNIEHSSYSDYLCQSKWWDLVSCLTNDPQHQVEERAERLDGVAGAGLGAERTMRKGTLSVGWEPLRRSRPQFTFCLSEYKLGFDLFSSNLRSDSNLLVSGARNKWVSAADELLLRLILETLLQPIYSGVALRWIIGILV